MENYQYQAMYTVKYNKLISKLSKYLYKHCKREVVNEVIHAQLQYAEGDKFNLLGFRNTRRHTDNILFQLMVFGMRQI